MRWVEQPTSALPFPTLSQVQVNALMGVMAPAGIVLGTTALDILDICIMYILAQRRSKIIFCYYLAKLNLYLCDSQTLTPDDRNDILVEDCEDNH